MLFNAQTAITVIAVPLYLYFIGEFLGFEEQLTEMIVIASNILSVAIALLTVAGLIGVYAAFQVGVEEKGIGRWDHKNFIYHEPMHVGTFVIRPSEKIVLQTVNLRDVERNSLVTFEVEGLSENKVIDAGFIRSRKEIEYNGHDQHLRFHDTVRVNKDRQIYLASRGPKEANPKTLRIYVSRFAVGKRGDL